MGRKSKINLNLEEIYEFHKKFRESPTKVRDAIREVAEKWGNETEQTYRDKITYAMGFKSKPDHRNKKTYYDVEIVTSDRLDIRVGHNSFLAKFLEVGTKDHEIKHAKRGQTYPRDVTAHVRGIKGSKALAKAFKEKHNLLVSEIQKSLSEILSNL